MWQDAQAWPVCSAQLGKARASCENKITASATKIAAPSRIGFALVMSFLPTRWLNAGPAWPAQPGTGSRSVQRRKIGDQVLTPLGVFQTGIGHGRVGHERARARQVPIEGGRVPGQPG